MTSTCPECAASLQHVCNRHPFDAKAYRASLDAETVAALAAEKRHGWIPTS